MMRVIFSKEFFKSVKKLPSLQQNQLAYILKLLEKNPFHPQLHTKKLSGKFTGLFSFRVARDWRVTFQFLTPQTIKLLRATHRRDIYK